MRRTALFLSNYRSCFSHLVQLTVYRWFREKKMRVEIVRS